MTTKSWKGIKEQQAQEEQQAQGTKYPDRTKEVVITGIKGGMLVAKEPEKLVPKWGITAIYDKRTGKTQPYINIKGLLWLAHQEAVGLQEIRTKVLEMQENRIIVQATVHCRRGTFSAHGTWTPRFENDTRGLEIAESRAVARALRFATGAGTSVEELPEEYLEAIEKQK